MMYSNYIDNRVCTKLTTGTIVDMKEGASINYRNSVVALHPVIEYYADGKLINVTSANGVYPSEYDIGDSIVIRYAPDDITKFMIEGESAKLLIGVVLTTLSSIWLVVSLFLIVEIKE